ncbi:MAG: SBBP repeat-containing protein [Vicinamibacterales bacterium]
MAGIELVYSGTGRQLKYTLVLEPGADANHVKLRYRGATSVERTVDGRLAVHTPIKTLYEEKPYVYQDVNGQRVEVAAAYEIEAGAQADGQTYGFRLAEYRRDLPLILDPFFAYAGYIGDDDADAGHGIAVDGSGNAYVVGYTTASSNTSFPETVGLGQNVLSMDAFVAKINAAGSGFVYISYVGGFNHDTGYGIAVDGGGHAYITGYTASADSFPHGTGFGGLTSFDSTYNGGTGDAYVAKLNADGTALLYAGYIGGSDDEAGYGIAVDFSHNAYVTGGTCSDQTSFPDGDGLGALTGPDVTYNGGSGGFEYYCDAFVAKVNPEGNQLIYAGYIGGTNYDEARSIAVQSSGQAYVTGSTGSSQSSFPETLGPDTTYNGGGDAFVAKVKSDGSGLNYAGYLGGGGKDDGNGIALRRDLIVTGRFLSIVHTALVTGSTETHANLFPATIGPDTSHNGFYDAFVARVTSGGSGLLFAGFIGGSGYDVGNAIAVDSNGYAYVVGATSSDETSFPVKSGPDTTYNDNGDAFVARLKKDGTGLLYASYVGGSGGTNPNVLDDFGLGIAVDVWGNAYITGITQSDQTTFPDGNGFGTLGGPDTIYKGLDAFVVKIANFFIYIPWPWPFDAFERADAR